MKMRNVLILGLCVAATVGMFASAVRAADEPRTDRDMLQALSDAGNFKVLLMLVDKAGLADTWKGKGPFTVFAPTDEAFAKLPKETLADLQKPENKERLAAILNYHVVPDRITAEQIVKLKILKAVTGRELNITRKGDVVMVNDARIIKLNVPASNGVIDEIDTVLMPPSS